MICYRDRELLDSIENGRLPDTLSDWLQLDKVKISEQSVKCAIIEKNREGVVLSTRIIDLKLQAHGHGFSKKSDYSQNSEYGTFIAFEKWVKQGTS